MNKKRFLFYKINAIEEASKIILEEITKVGFPEFDFVVVVAAAGISWAGAAAGKFGGVFCIPGAFGIPIGFIAPIEAIGPLGPIGPIGPIGPLGPLGPIGPIGP
jgi:hypothetical protein